MDYKELTQDLCSVYSQTGHGGADEIASICRKVLPETAELQRRPSASIGYGDDLFFTQEVPGEKKDPPPWVLRYRPSCWQPENKRNRRKAPGPWHLGHERRNCSSSWVNMFCLQKTLLAKA